MRIDWLIEQDIICLCLFHLSLFSSLKVIKRNDLFMREVEGVASINIVEAFLFIFISKFSTKISTDKRV